MSCYSIPNPTVFFKTTPLFVCIKPLPFVYSLPIPACVSYPVPFFPIPIFPVPIFPVPIFPVPVHLSIPLTPLVFVPSLPGPTMARVPSDFSQPIAPMVCAPADYIQPVADSQADGFESISFNLIEINTRERSERFANNETNNSVNREDSFDNAPASRISKKKFVILSKKIDKKFNYKCLGSRINRYSVALALSSVGEISSKINEICTFIGVKNNKRNKDRIYSILKKKPLITGHNEKPGINMPTNDLKSTHDKFSSFDSEIEGKGWILKTSLSFVRDVNLKSRECIRESIRYSLTEAKNTCVLVFGTINFNKYYISNVNQFGYYIKGSEIEDHGPEKKFMQLLNIVLIHDDNLLLLKSEESDVGHIDCTGSVVSSIKCCNHNFKRILYYAIVVKIQNVTIPFAELITSQHNGACIEKFLIDIKDV